MNGNKQAVYRDMGLLILRLGFGLSFFWFHGFPKLTRGPEGWAQTGAAMESLGLGFAPMWWGLAAALVEAVGGLLIAAGLFFRPTAIALALVMIVASVNHVVTDIGSPSHSFKNIWVFAGLYLIGPGRFSLDQLFVRKSGSLARSKPAWR